MYDRAPLLRTLGTPNNVEGSRVQWSLEEPIKSELVIQVNSWEPCGLWAQRQAWIQGRLDVAPCGVVVGGEAIISWNTPLL